MIRRNAVDGRTINLDLTWTDLGRPASVTYPNDQGISDPVRTISNTYALGLLTAVPSYATSIGYHANLMVNAVLHANNVTVTHVKDDNDIRRPKSITTTNATPNWASGTYGYDGAGNVKTIGSDWYTYDKVSRLTVGTTSAAAQRQCAAYPAFGAINGFGTGTTSCAASAISVDAGTNRMANPVSYNAAGSMQVWGGFNYSWDPLNQMAATWGTGITKRTFLYTADGERIEERVGADPLNPTSITLAARGLDDKVLRLLTKSGGTWSWTKDYVYRDGLSLASIETSGKG